VCVCVFFKYITPSTQYYTITQHFPQKIKKLKYFVTSEELKKYTSSILSRIYIFSVFFPRKKGGYSDIKKAGEEGDTFNFFYKSKPLKYKKHIFKQQQVNQYNKKLTHL